MNGEKIDTTVALEAPEQIRFRFRVAGPALRAAAHVVDLLIMAAILVGFVVLGTVLEVLGPGSFSDGGGGLFVGLLLLVAFSLQWGYFTLFEALNRGQTPGKRMFSLRVVKAGGEPIGFVDATLRNLVRAADWLPMGYATGVLAMMFDRQFRRLGDLVASTMVVVEETVRFAHPIRVMPPSVAEARGLPNRIVLDAEELRAIEAFLRRSVELGHELSAELAGLVAEPLARKHGYWHPDPIRLLALLYLRATAPMAASSAGAGSQAVGRIEGARA